MFTIPREGEPRERALLVGVVQKDDQTTQVDEHLDELALLADTAGADITGRIVQRRLRPDPATYIGRGKAEQLARQAEELDCHLIIFDDDLGPSQLKNLQKLVGDSIKVIDRSGLILDIFARHAMTREAKTQVELAHLQYLLPRLTRQWTHLERQMGGIGTRGGPGEAQIEVDRRLIRKRIQHLERALTRISAERHTQMQNRKSIYKIALVGYTNAGKSTLMNALTGAEVLVQDRLFATLDTTTRKMALPGSKPVLLSDTVGFIRKLPHHLVASFRATLAEVAEADLLLKVIDASSPQVVEHNHTITNVLRELDVASDSSITILNKIDRVQDDGKMRLLKREFPDGVMISASQRLRLDQVERAILAAQSRAYGDAELSVPDGYEHIISEMYDNLEVKARSYEDGMTRLSVHGPTDIIASFRHRLENGFNRKQETHRDKK